MTKENRTRSKPSAVVFDLDGTLVDSRADIANAVNHALVCSGRAEKSEVEIGAMVGDGARVLLARAANVPEEGPEVESLLSDYTAFYLEHPADRTRFVDGALEALDEIGGVAGGGLGLPVALCTNKARDITDRVLDKVGIRGRFSAVYGGGDGPEKKPSRGPLVAVARALGIEPRSLVMVGDGPQDILAARAAGCRSIGVVSLYQSSERMREAEPDIVVAAMHEVPGIVRRWLA
jgi:phosphoglycolate phosphatase